MHTHLHLYINLNHFAVHLKITQHCKSTICCCCFITKLCLSLWIHGLQLTSLLCPGRFPGKNTGANGHSFSRRSSPPTHQTQVSSTSTKNKSINFIWNYKGSRIGGKKSLRKTKRGERGGRGAQDGEPCTLVVDSSQCMAKPIQCCKVKLIN